MDPDRGVEPRDPIDHGERGGGRPGVPARDEDPLQPGLAGGVNDRLEIVVEAVRLEMTMTVDEAQAQPAALLWKRPTSLPSGSITTANQPKPGISLFGSLTDPPVRSAAARASSMDETSM